MRVQIVDPSAFTPPYDRALSAALVRAGVDVELVTSRFAYGDVLPAGGYAVSERFYRHAFGSPGGRLRQATKLMGHVPGMLRYRSAAAREADVAHFQWLTVPQLDERLLPRGLPVVLTAHDVLPREPKPGQLDAQRRLYERVDAIVVHSHHGRERLVVDLGVDPAKVHVIHHGAFEHLTRQADEAELLPELAGVDRPVVLCFGLIRPYKGIDVLLEAWRGIGDAELWIVGMPRMGLGALRERLLPSVRLIPRFVEDRELPAFFRRADLVVLPYREIDQSGVLFTAMAFGKPLLLSAVGGFPEVAEAGAAELVAPGDHGALHIALRRLLDDPARRDALAAGAARAAAGPYSWDAAARDHVALYEQLLGG